MEKNFKKIGTKEYVEKVEEKMGLDGQPELHVSYENPKPARKYFGGWGPGIKRKEWMREGD